MIRIERSFFSPTSSFQDPSPCPGRGQARLARAGEGSSHIYLDAEKNRRGVQNHCTLPAPARSPYRPFTHQHSFEPERSFEREVVDVRLGLDNGGLFL